MQRSLRARPPVSLFTGGLRSGPPSGGIWAGRLACDATLAAGTVLGDYTVVIVHALFEDPNQRTSLMKLTYMMDKT